MIYTHSILGGYICLKGSFVFHIPMLIAMLIFIRIPDEKFLDEAYPGRSYLAFYWYVITAALHGLFIIIDFIYFLSLDEIFGMAYHTTLLIFRYMQMVNICIMLILYATGETTGNFIN